MGFFWRTHGVQMFSGFGFFLGQGMVHTSSPVLGSTMLQPSCPVATGSAPTLPAVVPVTAEIQQSSLLGIFTSHHVPSAFSPWMGRVVPASSEVSGSYTWLGPRRQFAFCVRVSAGVEGVAVEVGAEDVGVNVTVEVADGDDETADAWPEAPIGVGVASAACGTAPEKKGRLQLIEAMSRIENHDQRIEWCMFAAFR